ncbi:MAG: hypothetical protein V4683_14745 [Bacteroidota bacterium]
MVRKVEYKQKITKELADLFKEIIFEATSKAKYPPNEYSITPSGHRVLNFVHKTDGISYYFVTFMHSHIRVGHTHFPEEDTIAGELVKLARLMKAGSYDPKVHNQLYEFGSRLLNKIKTS